jgi:hypothetical protein
MNHTRRTGKQSVPAKGSFDCYFAVCKGKPAAKILTCREQDGDLECLWLCDKHATELQSYYSAVDWDAGVDVSDIEEWKLTNHKGGTTFIRIGSRY